jgi:hypothetical protein
MIEASSTPAVKTNIPATTTRTSSNVRWRASSMLPTPYASNGAE